jgi:hypothetical protein
MFTECEGQAADDANDLLRVAAIGARFPGWGPSSEPPKAAFRPGTVSWATTNGKGEMGNRSVTVERFKEIERRPRDGRSLREIARALSCSRKADRKFKPPSRPGRFA